MMLLSAPGIAFSTEVPLPYKEVPYTPEERRRVMHFFSFSCPVCRQYQEPIVRWGRTLPREYDFESTPIVTGDVGNMAAARAWQALKVAAPGKTDIFADALYALVQDDGRSLSQEATLAMAVRMAGVDSTKFVKAWAAVSELSLQRIAAKMAEYRLTSTPSIGVGGRYVITPDNTNGNQELFIKLASGVVSKTMHQGR